MLGIKCDKHGLYNGAKVFSEPCDACSVIHAVNKLTYHVPNLERIQPIKVSRDLSEFGTHALLREIMQRLE
jgi:hypothetical protein